MNKSKRMQFQAVAILFGIFFLFLLVIAGILLGIKHKEQPEGEYIKREDATILLDAAAVSWTPHGDAQREADEAEKVVAKGDAGTETENLSAKYVSFAEMCDSFGQISELEKSIAGLEEKYEPEHVVLKEDWYDLYEQCLTVKGLSEQITRVEVVALDYDENMLIAEDGAYPFCSPDFLQYRFLPVTAYQRDGEFLTVYEQSGTQYTIHNVWVMEALPEYLQFFWNDFEIRVDGPTKDPSETATIITEDVREQVADLFFEDGSLSKVTAKLEKINGKILSLGDGNITVEGVGTLPFSENLKIYQIYDTLAKKYTGDLRIGYNFTDFVMQDGKVEACLITRDEAMENIRVLINSSNYQGRLHETVKATVDTDFIVRYGSYDNLQEQSFAAGEIVEFPMDSAYFSGDRIAIIPQALTGKVKLLSVERSQGTPQYRGTIEIVKTADGLAVINEVLLEEYLYCVVPSEMPASYPLEALKAQAVCARTYAYQKMIRSGLPAYGAHLDDSTSFQVYNNVKENVETTKAVRETKGELLYVADGLVDAYYYSTSCGFGTTADIWKSSAPVPEYLKSKRIGTTASDESFNEITLMEEETFRTYIESAYESDYESTEGWYRWTYTVDEIDCEAFAERLGNRLKTEVDSFSTIKNITCGQRGPGGVLDSVLIETDQGSYEVIGEYNIRYVLNDGLAKVCRQDGSEVAAPTLLPSSFFVLDVVTEGKSVVGYTITGGGFGHGVGMSQNGARHMAEAGMTSAQILTFFYDGSTVSAVY